MSENQQEPVQTNNSKEANPNPELADYNSALRNAWIACGLELDKTLLSLSAGGIGILITLLTTGSIEHYLEIVLFALAVLFFLGTLICMLWAFDLNRIHIEQTLKGLEGPDARLTKIDFLAKVFFLIGIIITLMIGVIAGVKSLNKHKEEQKMADEKKQALRIVENLNNLSAIKPTPASPLPNDLPLSANGISVIKPTATRSLNDLSSIKPVSTNTSSNQGSGSQQSGNQGAQQQGVNSSVQPNQPASDNSNTDTGK